MSFNFTVVVKIKIVQSIIMKIGYVSISHVKQVNVIQFLEFNISYVEFLDNLIPNKNLQYRTDKRGLYRCITCKQNMIRSLDLLFFFFCVCLDMRLSLSHRKSIVHLSYKFIEVRYLIHLIQNKYFLSITCFFF